MNREIKFRALKDDVSNCNWVYGDLVYQCDIPMIKRSKVAMLYDSCLKGTQGQFTGLTDKNGKEIYEGDIIRSNQIVGTHTVTFEKGGFGLRGNNDAEGINRYVRNNNFSSFSYMNGNNLEIIGNIHSNPELLNK